MGNLIKDFWTYAYKDKNYYGIVEVVKGDLQFRKMDGKFETHIEKALDYLMKPGVQVLSHMTVQSYSTYLNKDGRSSREMDEEAYYPFFLEFEPHVKSGQANFNAEYKKAAAEAYITASYLIYELDVDPEDILITMTNSRSIYLFVNPKTYGLKPSKVLHLIYRRMFDALNEYIDFKYVDTHQYRFNGLIKTPGAYYAGGYVVPISVGELKVLTADPELKSKYTRNKRSIDISVPARESNAFKELYFGAREEIIEELKEKANKGQNNAQKAGKNDITYINTEMACVKHIENNPIQVGQRNYALVSLAIGYKKAGYAENQVYEIVQGIADKWGHDESSSIIRSKVRLVFRHDYNFSCSYVKENLNEVCGSACKGCKFNKGAKKAQEDKFKVNKYAIDALKTNKASLRHYRAYLIMSRYDLVGKFFSPGEFNLEQRVVRELAKFTGSIRTIENGMVKVELTLEEKNYMLPNEFVDKGACEALGERLKQYLILYTAFVYKAGDKYGMMHVKPQKITEILGYKDVKSTYGLIKELADLGMAVFKNGFLFALYYSSYKVVSIEEYKAKKAREKAKKTYQHNQYEIEFDYELLSNGDQQLRLKLARGSP